MQLIINILIVFIFINCLLKLSFWKLWQITLAAAILAGFVFWAYKYAVEQSQVTIQNALETPSILNNIAVLVTIEVALCLGFCFSELKEIFSTKKDKQILFLKAYPSLLMLPALFYLLTYSFFYFSGIDFLNITIMFAVGVFLFILGGTWGIKFFFPEKDFRIEVHLLTSLFIGILGLVITTNGNILYIPKSQPINFKFLGLTFILFIGMFILGILVNKAYWKFKNI